MHCGAPAANWALTYFEPHRSLLVFRYCQTMTVKNKLRNILDFRAETLAPVMTQVTSCCDITASSNVSRLYRKFARWERFSSWQRSRAMETTTFRSSTPPSPELVWLIQP